MNGIPISRDNQPLIRMENVSIEFPVRTEGLIQKHLGTVKAVHDICLDVKSGETLALVGESGCGKTTMARMILRLLEPTSGRILFHGHDIAGLKGDALRSFRSRVQAVFQDPWASLNPYMKVRSIVREPLVINEKLSTKEMDRRVDEVLEAVGLRPSQAKNYPHEFSGGQRQRVAIASALVGRPELLVLDEPVSALDVSIRSQIMNLFKDIQAQYNVSYIMVAHDLGTTRYMADRIAVMYLGQVVENAEVENLFSNPKHPYTEALLSAALPAHPQAEHNEIILSGEVPSPIDPPSGCGFHPRCPKKLGDICSVESPRLLMSENNHDRRVACHLHAGL